MLLSVTACLFWGGFSISDNRGGVGGGGVEDKKGTITLLESIIEKLHMVH